MIFFWITLCSIHFGLSTKGNKSAEFLYIICIVVLIVLYSSVLLIFFIITWFFVGDCIILFLFYFLQWIAQLMHKVSYIHVLCYSILHMSALIPQIFWLCGTVAKVSLFSKGFACSMKIEAHRNNYLSTSRFIWDE